MAEHERFLTVYAQTRHYGGPEEGGWWYDWNQPVLTVEVPQYLTDEEIEAKREALKVVYSHLIHGDIGSVLGGQAIWVGLENERQEFASTERPYYS